MDMRLWMARVVTVSLLFLVTFLADAQHGNLAFIENKGQWPATIDFAARTPGGRLMVSPKGFSVYVFDPATWNSQHTHTTGEVSEADGSFYPDGDIRGHHVMITLEGGNHTAAATPLHPQPAYYNFFLGSDSSQWASRADAFEEIVYTGVYEGIDMRIQSVRDQLKYDFIVSPETDPSVVRLSFNGADNLYLSNGNLVIETSVGVLIERKPFTYQVLNGQRCEVPSAYALAGNEVTFVFPQGYDPCHELIIDPLLIFSTFSGSTADNWGSTATPGERGTLYSSGITNHLNAGGTFPATPGAFQTNYGGNYDIAILKYDSTGKQLLYASYLGGSSNESPHSLVMDVKTHDLLILGTTSSNNFPVSASAFQNFYQGGSNTGTTVFGYPNGSDIIVTRVSSTGDRFIGSTYLGGSGNDGLNPFNSLLVRNYGDDLRGDIITDTLGNVYISSVTSSTNFPAVNSFSTTYKGGATDAIVAKLSPNLNALQWAAFVGGSNVDAAHSIKFDSDFNIYLAGGTASANFPATADVYQAMHAGEVDGFMTKISNDGNTLLASTFTGTAAYNQVYFIDLNNSNEVYVYGQTSGSFPTTPGVYRNVNSGQFVQKFTSDLKSLIFSTVFGSGIGIPNISPTAFLVNECNNLYMTGWGGQINSSRGFWQSTTLNMPVTADALQKTTRGSDFYFIVLTGDASSLLYATYLGGNQSSIHVDGGTSRFDKSGIVYHAVCAGCGGGFDDFPTTTGAWSRTNNSGNCNNAAFKFDLSSLRARLQTNSVKFKSPGISQVCFPDTIRFQNLSTGGEIFEWDLGDGTKLTRTDTTSFLHQFKEAGNYLVKLKATDRNTCTGVDSVFTVIRVFKSDMKAQDDDAICFGTSYTLTASGGTTYSWTTEEGALPSTSFTPHETRKYFVTITDVNGCKKLDTVLLEVVPGIELKMDYEFVTDCFSRPQVLFRNLTEGKTDETFALDFGDGFTSDLPEVVHPYTQDGDYVLRLRGYKEFCVYELAVPLPVYTFLVPNIITPESTPGYNDSFVIQYGTKGRTPADAGIRVGVKMYNRWGIPVFSSADYHNDWKASGLEPGVYFYTISLNEKTYCKSWLHVVR